MPNLSIKNVPLPVVEKLRRLAAANHRSLQGELMALICRAAEGGHGGSGEQVSTEVRQVESGWKSIDRIWVEHCERRAVPVSGAPKSADILREERDSR